jgi:hypothetical protein
MRNVPKSYDVPIKTRKKKCRSGQFGQFEDRKDAERAVLTRRRENKKLSSVKVQIMLIKHLLMMSGEWRMKISLF